MIIIHLFVADLVHFCSFACFFGFPFPSQFFVSLFFFYAVFMHLSLLALLVFIYSPRCCAFVRLLDSFGFPFLFPVLFYYYYFFFMQYLCIYLFAADFVCLFVAHFFGFPFPFTVFVSVLLFYAAFMHLLPNVVFIYSPRILCLFVCSLFLWLSFSVPSFLCSQGSSYFFFCHHHHYYYYYYYKQYLCMHYMCVYYLFIYRIFCVFIRLLAFWLSISFRFMILFYAHTRAVVLFGTVRLAFTLLPQLVTF